MVGDSGTSRNGRKYNYYKCTNVKHKDGCHKKSVRKEIIEDLVLNEVMNTMFTDEVISEIVDKVIKLQGRENTAIPLLNERLAEDTETAAKLIQSKTGADVFKLVPIVSYSEDYNECIEQAKDDQRRGARPELTAYPDSIEQYDTIYLGYPRIFSEYRNAVRRLCNAECPRRVER